MTKPCVYNSQRKLKIQLKILPKKYSRVDGSKIFIILKKKKSYQKISVKKGYQVLKFYRK